MQWQSLESQHPCRSNFIFVNSVTNCKFRRWKSIARCATLSHEPKLNEAITSFWGIPSSDDHYPFSCRLTIACIVTCHMSFFIVSSGGEVLFVMACTGSRCMPYLFQAQVYKREGISLVELHERVGKCVILLCNGPKMADRCILWLSKTVQNLK